MPRFFLNARSPERLMPDLEGEELPDLSAARDMAASVAAELARTAPPNMCAEWFFEIADATGRTVLKLPFAQVAERDAG
jgi:hypothetical protein